MYDYCICYKILIIDAHKSYVNWLPHDHFNIVNQIHNTMTFYDTSILWEIRAVSMYMASCLSFIMYATQEQTEARW